MTKILCFCSMLVFVLLSAQAGAQPIKVGYVNILRIESESAMAKQAAETLKNEFAPREKQLQEQAVRMRDGIVKEITDVVMTKVKANSMDLVFDISGVSLNGVPTIMFARPDMDFTNDVVAQLNKPGNSPAPKASASPAKAKP